MLSSIQAGDSCFVNDYDDLDDDDDDDDDDED